MSTEIPYHFAHLLPNLLGSDFLPFFMCFFHIYVAPGRGRQYTGDKNFMTTERPFLVAHMLQVSK